MKRKPTVIIVDDLAEYREHLAAVLEEDFRVVDSVASGPQAVESCRVYHPDLVLMDVVMPKMSGVEATREILRQVDPAPKVVMISGLSNDALVLQAMDAGARDFVQKPVEADRLIRLLKSLAFEVEAA